MTKKLKVGVNLMWLVPGVVGGSEAYATGLLSRLVERTDIEIVSFALPSFVTRYPELAVKSRSVVASSLPGGRHVVRRVAAENLWLPRQFRSQRIDVAHHLGGIVSRSPVPAVVTLHDLQYLAYPEYFSLVKRRYLGLMQGSSLRRARIVTAISEFTRTQAIEQFGLDADKVVVVPPVLQRLPAPTDAQRAGVRKKFGLAGQFVLYPAAMYPHKNHLMLVRAFAQAAKDRPVDLVLTGATGAGAWGSAASTSAEVEALAEDLGIAKRMRMLGYVPPDVLSTLYTEATMLAFPSKFEGFGLPVFEAMSAGCPVVAAAGTALPAVVADAGVLVDPDDVGGWSAQIGRLLDDEDERQRLVVAGTARAAGLSSADQIETLVGAYREAAA